MTCRTIEDKLVQDSDKEMITAAGIPKYASNEDELKKYLDRGACRITRSNYLAMTQKERCAKLRFSIENIFRKTGHGKKGNEEDEKKIFRLAWGVIECLNNAAKYAKTNGQIDPPITLFYKDDEEKTEIHIIDTGKERVNLYKYTDMTEEEYFANLERSQDRPEGSNNIGLWTTTQTFDEVKFFSLIDGEDVVGIEAVLTQNKN